jgi:hypothetical protein
VAQPEILRQRIRRLRGEQQQQHPNSPGHDRPRQGIDTNQDHAKERAGKQPGDRDSRQRLTIESGQLQQGQRISHPGTEREETQTAQDVEPAGPGQQGEEQHQRRPGATGERAQHSPGSLGWDHASVEHWLRFISSVRSGAYPPRWSSRELSRGLGGGA